jgi:hypothetical protein
LTHSFIQIKQYHYYKTNGTYDSQQAEDDAAKKIEQGSIYSLFLFNGNAGRKLF